MSNNCYNTVKENLIRTITGKEKYLDSLCPNNPYTEEFMETGEILVRRATIEFLRLNISELKKILRDIENAIDSN